MLSSDDQQRIARYAAGDGDPAWRAATLEWIAADSERSAVAEEYVRITGASPADLPAWDERAQWARFAQTIGIGGDQRRVRRGIRVSAWGAPESFRGWLGQRAAPFVTGTLVAAAAVVAIVLMRVPSSRIAGSRGSHEYATAPGQRETVTLPDGTEITLAPASRMRVDAEYGRARRDVVLLDGEGYFVVHHDARRPFVVHARNGQAEDIGTRFVVRAYREDSTVRVTVADGVVALADSGAAGRVARSELSRGSLGVLDREGVVAVTAIDVDRALAWTRGELAFDRAPLRTVAADLSRWYGLDVRVASSVSDRQFTGRYTTESPDDVLASITAATGTAAERHGSTITIVGR